MNDITDIIKSDELTMSTIEIAELCNKRHDNVMRTANILKKKGIIMAPQIEEPYTSGNGRISTRKVYHLNKTESLNLVANLSPEFTAKIIDRWLELEGQHNIPQTRAEALRLAADLEEKNAELQARLDVTEPESKALRRIARSKGSLIPTEAAKVLEIKRKDLFEHLREKRWAFLNGKRKWTPYSDKVQSGHLEIHTSIFSRSDGVDCINEQMVITPKGLARLSYDFELNNDYTRLYYKNGHERKEAG